MSIINGLFTQIVNKTVGNSTVEDSLFNLLIPNNSFQPNQFIVGSNISLKSTGFISRQSSQFTLNVKLNNIIIGTTGAINLTTVQNAAFFLDFGFTVQSLGVTGTLIGQGYINIPKSKDSFELVNQNPITIDTTIKNTLDLTVIWGAVATGNTITSTNHRIIQS